MRVVNRRQLMTERRGHPSASRGRPRTDLVPRVDAEEDLQHLMERGRRLRELRERSQLTQVQLAERCGFDQGQVSNWEAGRKGMTATTAILLAGALNATTEQLLCATAPLKAALEEDDLASDPYPNRRRLRHLPEFQAAPREVQEFVRQRTRAHGDQSFFEWIDEFRWLLKLHEDEDWHILRPRREAPLLRRQQRPRVR